MEILVTQIVALLSLTAITSLLIIFGYREFRYRKKVDFLIHLVDKGYESNKIDLNKL